MNKFVYNSKGQAQPERSVHIGKEAFKNNEHIGIRWLGGGGVMINSFGTIIMIDPVLKGFDMPLLFDSVITPEEIDHIDGYFVTHIDNDHFSAETLRSVKEVTAEIHSTHYVASEMKRICDADANGHTWNDMIGIKNVSVEMTPVDHDWQNSFEEYNYRVWDKKEYCGYYIRTNGKKIWLVGDSRLMSEHLNMEEPDVILFDFSDDDYHIGFDNSMLLAKTYPNAKLVLIHWGTVDAPENKPFNGDPQKVLDNVYAPERVVILYPGEEFIV